MEVNSPSHKRRMDNSGRFFKPENEHITHVLHRVKERFGLDFTEVDYRAMLKLTMGHGHKIYTLNNGTFVFAINYKEVHFWVIYGRRGNPRFQCSDLPPRLKTVLIPGQSFALPDYLYHITSRENFTKLVIDNVEEIKALSVHLDLNNKAEFFISNPAPRLMKAGALKYKEYLQGMEKMLDTVYGIAVSIVSLELMKNQIPYEGHIPYKLRPVSD